MNGPRPMPNGAEPRVDPPAAIPGWRRSTVVGIVMVLACVAAFQSLVAHPSMLWFDVDPVLDPFPFAGIAPSTGVALDAAAAFLGALAAWVVRRRVDAAGAAAMVLATFGAAVAWSHALGSADDAWRAAQWCGAIVGATGAGVALRALGTDGQSARAMALAVLASAAVPMALRGAVQLWIEHPATVEAYRANMAEVLAARGWSPGSPQALTYERRLMQPEVTAWFGMSNVASSILGAASIVLGGAACAAWRRSPRVALALGAAALACAATVAVNGSKGAIAAMVLALGFVAWCGWRAPGPRWRSAVALGLVALPVVAVVVRGWFGAGWAERSLLFRAHYVEASWRMAISQPVLGVGPAGFGDAYLLHRPWLSPEEVQSAHAAWADWLACLGVGGWSWIVLLAVGVAWVARGGTPAARDPGSGSTEARVLADGASGRVGGSADPRGPVVASALAAATVVMLAAVTEPVLDQPAMVMRAVAAALSAMVAAAVAWTAMVSTAGSAVRVSLAGGALMLAIHAQVEMTLWWPGAVAWAAMMIAIAAMDPQGASRLAPARASARDLSEIPPRMVASFSLALMLLAAYQLAFELPGARAAERRVAEAAAPLAALGRERLAGTAPPASAVAEARLAAGRALDATAIYAVPSWQPTEKWLLRPAVRVAALVQLASASGAPGWREAADESLGVLPVQHGVAAAGELLAEERARSGSPEDLVPLIKWAQIHLALDPRAVRARVRLAEAHAQRGDQAAAAAAARAALRIDESYALDPLRRLPEGERRRLEALTDGAETSPP